MTMKKHGSIPNTSAGLQRSAAGALLAAFLFLCGNAAQATAAQPGETRNDDATAARVTPGGLPDPQFHGQWAAASPPYSLRALVSEADADLAAGHPGRAMVQLERARLLAPRSPIVATGMARVQAAANLPAADPGRVTRALQRLSANEWGWVALTSLALSAAGLVLVAWTVGRRRRFVMLVLAGAAAATFGLLAAWRVTPPASRAVVIATEATARIAPFAASEVAFSVPEGTVVTIERTHGDYALIAGRDGRAWVPRASVETILSAPDPRS
jgi:hypothetical protein